MQREHHQAVVQVDQIPVVVWELLVALEYVAEWVVEEVQRMSPEQLLDPGLEGMAGLECSESERHEY